MNTQELALGNKALECFRSAGERHAYSPEQHCCIGDVEGRYQWWLQMGDSMTISGSTFPLSTVITPCDEHLPEFIKAFGLAE